MKRSRCLLKSVVLLVSCLALLAAPHSATAGSAGSGSPYQPRIPAIEFSVDQDVIAPGDCTTLRWDVENVNGVYLDGQGVTGHGTRDVCPMQTTDYVLQVLTDSGDVYRTVTVYVNGDNPGPDTGFPQLVLEDFSLGSDPYTAWPAGQPFVKNRSYVLVLKIRNVGDGAFVPMPGNANYTVVVSLRSADNRRELQRSRYTANRASTLYRTDVLEPGATYVDPPYITGLKLRQTAYAANLVVTFSPSPWLNMPSTTVTKRISIGSGGSTGRATCTTGQARIIAPASGSVVRGVIAVYGTATCTDFAYYKFEFVDSRCGPSGACFLAGKFTQPVVDGVLMTWDTHKTWDGTPIANGTYVLRLTVMGLDSPYGSMLAQQPTVQITIDNR
jgi:hypothetical protein